MENFYNFTKNIENVDIFHLVWCQIEFSFKQINL